MGERERDRERERERERERQRDRNRDKDREDTMTGRIMYATLLPQTIRHTDKEGQA